MLSGLQFERSKVRFFLQIEKRKAGIIRQISHAFPRFFLNFGFAFLDKHEIKIYRLSFVRIYGHPGSRTKDYTR